MKAATVAFAILAFAGSASGSAMTGANEPIADNELGLTAKACAEAHCASKDGLELWLTLQRECTADQTTFLAAKEVNEAKRAEAAALWSPTAVGTVSALVGVLGLVAGFSQGAQ